MKTGITRILEAAGFNVDDIGERFTYTPIKRMWDARLVWSVNFGRPKWDVTFEETLERFCQRIAASPLPHPNCRCVIA